MTSLITKSVTALFAHKDQAGAIQTDFAEDEIAYSTSLYTYLIQE